LLSRHYSTDWYILAYYILFIQ